MEKKELRTKWIFMTMAVMLLIISCLGFTGAWFTDAEDVEGEGTEPIIQPILYDYTSTGQLVDLESYYFTPTAENLTDTSKDVVVRFTSDTNVTKLLLRVIVNITWGYMEDSVFEEDSEATANSYPALLPNYSSANWSKGYIYMEGLSEHYTEEEIEEYFTNNMSTYFYYNDVITSPTVAQISIYDTLTFNNSTYSNLLGMTAKITVSVEGKDATKKTTGEIEEVEGVWTISVSGKWTPAPDEDRPTILWIQTVQSDSDFMQ